MTINPSEKIIIIDIYQKTKEEPQQRRFEAIHKISDIEKEIVYERTLDEILETLFAKYKAKEFELLPQNFFSYKLSRIDYEKAYINAWKLILKSDKET